jgi:hypothetical protein
MSNDIPNLTSSQRHSMEAYAALMREVKIRTSWIDFAIMGRTGMDGQMVREFGFLQLRMICELVALACLVAHGDIPATKGSKFQSEGFADGLIKALEGLNPDAFPYPVMMTAPAPRHHHFIDRPDADWMTKAELLRLYGRDCGGALHKGNMKNLMKPKPPVVKNFPELSAPAQRLMNLLGIHKIALEAGNVQFICFLGDHTEPVRTMIGVGEFVPRSPRSGPSGL